MASSDAAETERVIRAKLEASGQYGKMRAMIMEAALQTVTTASPGSAAALSFHPTPALTQATDAGAVELELVQEYLQYLGLQYTARVLQLEAGLPEAPLRTSAELQQALHLPPSDGPCLSALVRAGGAAPTAAASTGSASVAGGLAKAAGPANGAVEASAAGDDDDSNSEAGSGDGDDESAASDHNQPGGQDTTYFISKWKRRHFVRHNQVSGQQVQIEYLTDCHTVVLDELDSMTVDDCEGGELVIAACEGSVFLRNCKNMTVHVACKQLRTRDCEHLKLHIFTTTDPVVEMSHHVSFQPFNLRLPGLQRLFADARLDPKSNRFVHVYDFTPSEPQLPAPHFEVHFPQHGLVMENRYATYGVPECPPEIEALLALRLMPAASSESGKNKSYDIRTGAQVWAQAGAVPVPVVAATAAAAASAAQAKSSEEDEGEDEEIASDDDDDDSDVADDASSSASSSAAAKKSAQLPQAAVPAPALPGASRAPLAPIPAPGAAAAAAHAATPGGIDNEDYSSFDDDEDDEDDADDKYEVDEDEDDF